MQFLAALLACSERSSPYTLKLYGPVMRPEKSGMVLGCTSLWTAPQILWSLIYVICGSFQLMAAIFFLISVKELALYGVVFAGCWSIMIGITGGMVTCIGALSRKRQETLLFLAASILAVNIIAVLLTEWKLYFLDMPKLLSTYTNHMLIDCALFVVRISISTVIVVAFLDSQFAYCSAQSLPKRRRRIFKRANHSPDSVPDIEYIIPRPKPPSKSSKPHQIYDAYAQSWVFDAENPGTSNGLSPSSGSPYLKILQNGTPKNPQARPNGLQHAPTVKEVTLLIDNPVVHVEEASDDNTSNSDRKLCHMKSFSRSASPVVLSASSSQLSLNNYNPAPANPPIYQYLEKLTEPEIYRSRLNTAVSNKSEEEESLQAPQTAPMRRVEAVSPQVVEPVRYASLMKELQKAIVSKKEPPSVTSPVSNSESQSQSKSSDTEPLAVWRKNSDPSGSEKTLSAVGSMGEIGSPLTEMVVPPDRSPSSLGKGARVLVRYPESQSTSGYSSPSHGPTPNWSTTSSINGSNHEPSKPVSYHIHNAKSTTVISLYSQPTAQSKSKSVTLVKITGEPDPLDNSRTIPETPIFSSSLISNINCSKSFPFVDTSSIPQPTSLPNIHSLQNTTSSLHLVDKPADSNNSGIWNVRSLLRKKKHHLVPRLCPELEGAIIKSESLAYLSEVELMARARRNEEIQRQIEQRVSQQLGVPRTDSESNC
ncbi:hypothetical protein HUJ05_005032 [Dendroctonus ponderosae]|nr:hypothetical protein HUJ05_005032 [Dendroctonus ponderosae]KAH1010789.1 hypothetical protein HUJ05_005032 [Dendroctonus ponderosae]